MKLFFYENLLSKENYKLYILNAIKKDMIEKK